MPRIRLAANAFSLTAVLAACETDDRPAANPPTASESSRTDDLSVTDTATSTVALPLTYRDDYHTRGARSWQMQSIQNGGRVCGVDVRLVVDGSTVTPDKNPYASGHFMELGAQLSPGIDHQVVVEVIRGDPRNIQYSVVVRTRTQMR